MAETLFDRDLRALMAFVEEGRRAQPNNGMPWAVLTGLREVIRSDCAGFTEFDMPAKAILTEQFEEEQGERTLIRDDPHSKDSPYWPLSHDFLPCQYFVANGNQSRVTKYSDFYTDRELRGTAFFCELNQGDHLRRMAIPLPCGPGRTRRILLDRERGRDFSERDRLVAELLRPHLYEIYLHAQRKERDVPRLSQREQEVLCLAAQGMSNAGIARELFISVGTVRKHMEHIFDRTGVRSRAAAAALVLPHLSVIDPH
jgi:DNA-binding CsgD family transcriptional regulator